MLCKRTVPGIREGRCKNDVNIVLLGDWHYDWETRSSQGAVATIFCQKLWMLKPAENNWLWSETNFIDNKHGIFSLNF